MIDSDTTASQRERILKRTFFLFLVTSLAVSLIYWLASASYVESQKTLFLKLNALLSGYPAFWFNVTQLGDALVLLPLLSFLVIRCPACWVSLFAAAPLATVFSRLGKSFFAVPRPAAVIPPDQFSQMGSLLNGHNSLPSGHTITAFAAVGALAAMIYLRKRGFGSAFLILAISIFGVIIALSRVAVGAHWPADLVLGALYGLTSGLGGALLAHRYRGWWAQMPRSRYRLINVILLLLFCVALLADEGRRSLPIVVIAIVAALITSAYLLINRKP